MKILQVHNQYKSLTGDDSVVEEEFKLLSKNGHEVIQFLKTNSELDSMGVFKKIELAKSMRSSKAVESEFRNILLTEIPDIVHVHNLFPLISPVIIEVANKLKIPLVQTLHNYRLLCVNTLFYRQGNICEDCLTGSFTNGIKHKCYNDSYLQSLLMADVIQYHKRKGTWYEKVDAYICLSEFAKGKFIEGGIPEHKLKVKANFVLSKNSDTEFENYFLFAGKLEEQKGLEDFLELAANRPDVVFKVAGFCAVPEVFKTLDNVEYLGELPREQLMLYMKKCKAILFLSKMYEGMPMTILEAFAHGKAVVARNRGAMSEMIVNGENGLLYSDINQLVERVDELESIDSCKKLGANAYLAYNEQYSEEVGYRNIMEVYNSLV